MKKISNSAGAMNIGTSMTQMCFLRIDFVYIVNPKQIWQELNIYYINRMIVITYFIRKINTIL